MATPVLLTRSAPPALMPALSRVLFLATTALAAPAWATLNNPVVITLSAPGGIVGNPTPINVTDSVNPAQGITVGDGTHIGSDWMLPNEFIHFVGNSILVNIAAGAVNGSGQLVTGYLGLNGVHAQYQLNSLSITGNTITGFNGTVTGLTSPTTLAAFVTLTTPNSLTINLDNLVLTPVPGGGESDALAVLTINLLTQPVPEPAAWALLLAGGAGLLGFRHTKARRV